MDGLVLKALLLFAAFHPAGPGQGPSKQADSADRGNEESEFVGGHVFPLLGFNWLGFKFTRLATAGRHG